MSLILALIERYSVVLRHANLWILGASKRGKLIILAALAENIKHSCLGKKYSRSSSFSFFW